MNEYTVAVYIRLSIDDGITESLSIPSQRKLINQYIETLEIPSVKILEFVDNGFTGKNMDRPALQEMLRLVEVGEINCIIIKDFSRLSRTSAESSYLIDKIFPSFYVRFISISDNFDSGDYKETTGGLNVTFKYILNDYYSKDLSRKVKSALHQRMASGTNIVTNAIYGYQKNDAGKWEPDPVASKVVAEIFRMALKGLATSQIRDMLYEKRYPTPQEYIDTKRGKDVVVECVWTARMVLHTLTNEQYTGTYISGKQVSKAVGSHSKDRVDKSQWIIIPDSHPEIVSKEDFAKVQEMLKFRKGSTTTKPLKCDLSHPKRARMLNGDFIAATPIYGYKKAEDGKWVIDEPAAQVIGLIYKMALKEMSYADISEKLFDLGYAMPSEHVKLNRGHDITPTNRWTENSIREILKNEQYIGSYVSGKIIKDYETGRSYHVPKNEWIIIPNKHPAIISKAIFDKVQKKTAEIKTTRRNRRNRDYLLQGVATCGCCGYALMYDDSCGREMYRCNHTLANPSALCHKLKVSAPELDEAVISIIMKQAEVVLENNDLHKLMDAGDVKGKRADYKSKIDEAEKQMAEFYEQYALGELNEEEFYALLNESTKKQEKLKNDFADLRKVEREREVKILLNEAASKALDESAIPGVLINELIEKVYVLPDNQINIDWKITDFSVTQ